MEWALYVGAFIFVGTIGGMFWLRNRPLRDARGNIVDELGRPISELSSEANVVLITLRDSIQPLSGYELRTYVTMPRQNFYAMMTELKLQNLVLDEIDKLGAHNVRRYRLSEEGRALLRERDVA